MIQTLPSLEPSVYLLARDQSGAILEIEELVIVPLALGRFPGEVVFDPRKAAPLFEAAMRVERAPEIGAGGRRQREQAAEQESTKRHRTAYA